MTKGESEQHRSKEGRGTGRHRFSISETSDCPQLPGALLKENSDRALTSSHLHKHFSRNGFTSRKLCWICTSTLNSHLPGEANAPT